MSRPLTPAGRQFLQMLFERNGRRLCFMDSRPSQRLLDDGYITMDYETIRVRPNGDEVKDFVVRITNAGLAALDTNP